MHIHIEKGENEAKFWLEPIIQLAYNHDFTTKELKVIINHLKENERTIKDKWNLHFNR